MAYKRSTNNVSSVNVTEEREACSKKWFAIYSRPRSEKKIASLLANKGIEYYLPIQKQRRKWSDRYKNVDTVVIPMIIFAQYGDFDLNEIARNPNVIRLISSPGSKSPAIINNAEIERIKFILGQSDIPIEFDSNIFKVEDDVRVIRGKLIGLTGKVIEISEELSELIVYLPLLGGAKLRIEKINLEVIK